MGFRPSSGGSAEAKEQLQVSLRPYRTRSEVRRVCPVVTLGHKHLGTWRKSSFTLVASGKLRLTLRGPRFRGRYLRQGATVLGIGVALHGGLGYLERILSSRAPITATVVCSPLYEDEDRISS